MKDFILNLLTQFVLFLYENCELEAAVICYWGIPTTIITHAEKLVWSVFVGVIVLLIKSWLMRTWPKYFNPNKTNNNEPNA